MTRSAPNRIALSCSIKIMRSVTGVHASQQPADSTEDDFASWATPHIDSMAHLAARLASPAERDDIVQEALARAWVKRRQYDPRRGSPAVWLLAITADQARQAMRKRRPVSLLGDVPAHVRTADDQIDVDYALTALSPRQRMAVDCFYFVGLSTTETALVMRCSEGTVKSTLADARKRLRPLLEDQDGHR